MIKNPGELGALISDSLEKDLPDWYFNVLHRLLEAFLPEMKFSEAIEDPRSAGALLGHLLSYCQSAEQMMANSPNSNPFLSASETLLTGEVLEGHENFNSEISQLKSEITAALSGGLLNMPGESEEIAEGFSAGLSKGSISEDGRNLVNGSEATPIYLQLFLFGEIWQESLKSLEELHRLLCHSLGDSIVGDLERLRKLCDRVGYKIGKRGRPSGQKRDIDEISLSVFNALKAAQDPADENIISKLKSDHA